MVDPLFIFTRFCLKSSSVTGPQPHAPSISAINSANFLDVALYLYAAVLHLAKTIGGVSFIFASDTASVEGLPSSVEGLPIGDAEEVYLQHENSVGWVNKSEKR